MGWRVEEEGERRQGARGRGGGWRGWRVGAAVVEGGGDVVMWCTGHRVGAEPTCPRWCGAAHTQQVFVPRSAAPQKGLGDGQRPSPSRQAHRPTPASEGKGSGGRELGGQGARVEGDTRGEMQAGGNGGGDTHLTCVSSRLRSRNFPDLGLEVGVENRDLRQRAGSQTRNARGTELSVLQHF